MSLRDFFKLPALVAFVLGVLLSGMVMNLVSGAKNKVGG